MADNNEQVLSTSNQQPEQNNNSQEEMPKIKPTFGNRFIKFIKSRGFIFGCSVFLAILSVFFLFLIDENNMYRPAWLNNDFFKSIGKIFGSQAFNVNITSWFILAIFWICFFIVFTLVFLRKPIVESCQKRYRAKNNGQEMSAEDTNKIIIRFYVIASLIWAALLAVFFIFFPYGSMDWAKAADPVWNVVKSLGLFVILLASVPVAIAVVVLVIKLIIFLISLIAGSISKTVMSSEAYQESMAAAALASARLRKEAGKINNDNGSPTDEVRNGGIIFPALLDLDEQYKDGPVDLNAGPVDLSKLAENFQAFLANQKKLYFDIDLIRGFIAGLSCCRLIILQGLSGTGKTSLPREFSNFCCGRATFYPVQATWRDKTDLMGYYSDFTGDYKESELLKNLYRAGYNPDEINLFVLDEANISRVEYYFADFLSIYEYPSADWWIQLINPKEGYVMPKNIPLGKIKLPDNGWFFATINVDDSTFAISDKVYDRGMVLDFQEMNKAFTCKGNDKPCKLGYKELMEAFAKASSTTAYCMTDDDVKKFLGVCDFICDTFEVKFGNRVYNQIKNFVPVFVALGGDKEKALDIMLANKILRKVDALYESYVEEGLNQLSKLLASTYGPDKFAESQRMIVRFKKKFI